MNKSSIFGQQSQELLKIYEEAGSNKKVLLCIIDYAKEKHVAMCCNANGDMLHKPFSVLNTPTGIEYMVSEVKRSCINHNIKPKHVIFGGEDCGTYRENFISCLREKGYLVFGVNPKDAKDQRSNLQASTDKLDLLGIARLLINRRGNCAPCQRGIYLDLRTLVRHRRKLVSLKTEERNRMHSIVDVLLPGFLNEMKSGVTPFSKVSLMIMEKNFSAKQICRRKSSTLIRQISNAGGHKPSEVAAKLGAYASTVLVSLPEHVSTLQISLDQHVSMYRCIQKSISILENEIATTLAQTQGAFLLTLKGVGLVLSAGIVAELGDPLLQRPINNLRSYAGIVPRIFQTGGEDSKARTGHVSKRCNHILKDYLVQSASHQGLHGVADLQRDYHRRDALGQHADYGIAQKYLRIAIRLMRNSEVYLPPELQHPDTPPEARAEYYQTLWPTLLDKLKKYNAHKVAFSPNNPLGMWREMVQEFYGIELIM